PVTVAEVARIAVVAPLDQAGEPTVITVVGEAIESCQSRQRIETDEPRLGRDDGLEHLLDLPSPRAPLAVEQALEEVETTGLERRRRGVARHDRLDHRGQQAHLLELAHASGSVARHRRSFSWLATAAGSVADLDARSPRGPRLSSCARPVGSACRCRGSRSTRWRAGPAPRQP